MEIRIPAGRDDYLRAFALYRVLVDYARRTHPALNILELLEESHRSIEEETGIPHPVDSYDQALHGEELLAADLFHVEGLLCSGAVHGWAIANQHPAFWFPMPCITPSCAGLAMWQHCEACRGTAGSSDDWRGALASRPLTSRTSRTTRRRSRRERPPE